MSQPLINISQDVLSGTPVFYGTRVPVRNLLDYLETGETIETFLEDFPSVSRGQIMRFLDTAGDLMIAQANENID
jgi:uncharacterized protein (DUF433 family)